MSKRAAKKAPPKAKAKPKAKKARKAVKKLDEAAEWKVRSARLVAKPPNATDRPRP